MRRERLPAGWHRERHGGPRAPRLASANLLRVDPGASRIPPMPRAWTRRHAKIAAEHAPAGASGSSTNVSRFALDDERALVRSTVGAYQATSTTQRRFRAETSPSWTSRATTEVAAIESDALASTAAAWSRARARRAGGRSLSGFACMRPSDTAPPVIPRGAEHGAHAPPDVRRRRTQCSPRRRVGRQGRVVSELALTATGAMRRRMGPLQAERARGAGAILSLPVFDGVGAGGHPERPRRMDVGWHATASRCCGLRDVEDQPGAALLAQQLRAGFRRAAAR